MPEPIHQSLADGRWFQLTLYEQLGNIGSEVSRALKARSVGNAERMFKAVDRALELFDFTIADPRLRGRLREICRAREVVCDFFYGDNEYHSDGPSLDRYFLAYAMAARLERERRTPTPDPSNLTTGALPATDPLDGEQASCAKVDLTEVGGGRSEPWSPPPTRPGAPGK